MKSRRGACGSLIEPFLVEIAIEPDRAAGGDSPQRPVGAAKIEGNWSWPGPRWHKGASRFRAYIDGQSPSGARGRGSPEAGRSSAFRADSGSPDADTELH